MTKVAVIQSNYIPWKGYFDIIHDVDLFIFYDDVQYTKNDWRNRNQIKTRHGLHWLTIPVGSHTNKLIYQIELTESQWREKHWTTIQQSYARAQYLNQYLDFFQEVYQDSKWKNLSAFNQFLIKSICTEFLHIKTEFRDSREYSPKGQKLERLLDLLRQAGATHYVSGPSAKGYIDKQLFTESGIELTYKDYSGYPEYPQLFPPFEHQVSIIDVLLTCGPQASYYVWGWRNATPVAFNNGALTGMTYETEQL